MVLLSVFRLILFMPRSNGNHIQGGKFSNSHTTAIDATKKPAQAAEKLACVSKITLGIIRQIGKSYNRSISFTDEDACLLVKIRGNCTIQEVRVYTSDKQATKEVMLQALE